MRVVVGILSCLFLLTACNASVPSGQNGGGSGSGIAIDWVDFVKINNTEYHLLRDGVIANPKQVGKKIGTVTFKVSGNIHNPNYQSQNGDAAFLEPGTRIYSVKDYPSLSIIAAESPNTIHGYKLYYSRDAIKKYHWNYQSMPKNKVTRVEMYSLPDQGEPKKIRQIKKDGVQPFFAVLKSGKTNDALRPDWSEHPKHFAMVFCTDEAIAYRYHLFFDGTHYFWHPSNTSILPDRIKKYLQK